MNNLKMGKRQLLLAIDQIKEDTILDHQQTPCNGLCKFSQDLISSISCITQEVEEKQLVFCNKQEWRVSSKYFFANYLPGKCLIETSSFLRGWSSNSPPTVPLYK